MEMASAEWRAWFIIIFFCFCFSETLVPEKSSLGLGAYGCSVHLFNVTAIFFYNFRYAFGQWSRNGMADTIIAYRVATGGYEIQV